MRDKLINKMAEAIRLVNLYGKEDGHEYIEGSRKIAEAALDALLGELEEVTVYPSCPTSQCDITNAEELYQQLLDMRK